MKLGSSISRRRGGGDGTPSWPPPGVKKPLQPRARKPGALLSVGVLTVVGFGAGWLVATQMLFPSPPPPGDLFAVPDLYSADFEEARRRIEEAGLSLGIVDPFRHPSVDSGRVVGQDPLPGQLASPASPVRVSVSLGSERRLVPDVSLLRSERAREVLEATGFTVRIDSVQSPEPRGRVTSLSPAAGTQLSVPGEVQLYVSIGPNQIVLPTLVGMDEAAAREIVAALGLLLIRTEEDRPGMEPGRVLEQDPPTQELLEPGSVVRIVVGRRGAVPDTIPGR